MPSKRASRRFLPLFAAPLIALALACGPASAQTPPPGSISLRWDNCRSDGGVAAKTFACDTNSGSEVLVISAYPPVDVSQLNGVETSITVWSTAASTPSWWTFVSGGCRGTIGMNASFTPPATSTTCLDAWLGQAAGGYDFQLNYNSPNNSLLRTVGAIAGTTSVPANTEVYVSTVVFRHTKSVGAGACTGCAVPACIGLNSVRLTEPAGVGDYTMIQPLPGTTSDVVGWQMDASMPENIFPYHGTGVWEKDFLSCSAAVTPARRPTWGAIHSLYR